MASRKQKQGSDEGERAETTSDGPGCVKLVLGIVALWALVCGVTVSGKHYGLRDCSCEHGVEVDTGR